MSGFTIPSNFVALIIGIFRILRVILKAVGESDMSWMDDVLGKMGYTEDATMWN